MCPWSLTPSHTNLPHHTSFTEAVAKMNTFIWLILLLNLSEAACYNTGARIRYAFAALKSDGSVVAWGDASAGGSTAFLSPPGASLASGVVTVYSTGSAFAALKSDGSVVIPVTRYHRNA